MTPPAVQLDCVSKIFRRGANFDSLRDMIADRIIPGRARARRQETEFWAVREVSFAVSPGEAFGIIGPNGAGKSTVLKLLAGILRPNGGTIRSAGRVSALIELGAGFHGDLTGRENIYLNASILGMSRCDARAKFQEIVDFAGIGDFLDTPVKRYSSGMHARLGFAIAAHVNPRILLVDEVLSVGDRVFRAKCMEKMRGFLEQGVAVIFVSHDLGAVGRFCDRALVLNHGRETFCGPVSEAIARYYASSDSQFAPSARGNADVEIQSARLCRPNGEKIYAAKPGDLVQFEFDAVFHRPMRQPSFGMSILRSDDQLLIFETSSTRLGVQARPVQPGDRLHVEYRVALNMLPGEYAIGLHVRERDALSYAFEQSTAARVLVEGIPTCGGAAYLNPHVCVTESMRTISHVGSLGPELAIGCPGN